MSEADKLALAEVQLDKVSQELEGSHLREKAMGTKLLAMAKDLERVQHNLLSGLHMKVALGVRMTEAADSLGDVSQQLQLLVSQSITSKK